MNRCDQLQREVEALTAKVADLEAKVRDLYAQQSKPRRGTADRSSPYDAGDPNIRRAMREAFNDDD